ncbi:MAG TPA: class I SAM-dependent methyltransferase, partial [Pseudoxanthomonas sp.]|nr:class I SAM-dependent methyltransferase [Pseudoxanthomonas sp.]
MNTFPFDHHPVAFLRPRINHPYAWVGHIPFAYLLVDILRPRRLVELGTDSGNSYLAFCQAIVHLQATTQATAIDSWEGDPHARFYGESVYATLSAYHDPRYGGFSTLMRSWFDDAVKQFKDGSIDLLHIDGLHTYEAVRHDFETWLPKLSDRAVVIFHDSQVRERGFGVWKFIEELRQSHRCFDFSHSNGLAVVEVGKKAPAAFKAFMDHALQEPANVQSYFEAIAATIIDEKTDSPVQVGAEARNVECRVYYRKQGQEYDEARSVMLNSDVHSGPVDLKFQLPEGERPDFIRLDPADVPCVFGLRQMTLSAAKHKHPLVIRNEPSRIRGVSGESLPASAQQWVRLLTLDSDPFIELAVDDVWATFDKKSAITVEFGIEYEAVLSAPELIPLAHSGALSLQESRSSGAGQWGYAAIQRQVVQIQSELQALAAGGSLNEHVHSLAKHVDTLTHNQTHSMAAFSERVDDIGQRLSQAAVVQSGSADGLGAYVGQLA